MYIFWLLVFDTLSFKAGPRQAYVRNTPRMCQIRTEISTCKYSKLLYLRALASGKITSVYCQILEILGQKCCVFAI